MPWCFNLDSGIFGELMASLGGDAVSLKDIAAMFSSGDEPRMEVLQPEALSMCHRAGLLSPSLSSSDSSAPGSLS